MPETQQGSRWQAIGMMEAHESSDRDDSGTKPGKPRELGRNSGVSGCQRKCVWASGDGRQRLGGGGGFGGFSTGVRVAATKVQEVGAT